MSKVIIKNRKGAEERLEERMLSRGEVEGPLQINPFGFFEGANKRYYYAFRVRFKLDGEPTYGIFQVYNDNGSIVDVRGIIVGQGQQLG